MTTRSAARRRWRVVHVVVVAHITALAIARDASGQGGLPRAATPRVQLEARADYIASRPAAAHVGVGFAVPAGTYVRLGGVAAAGQAWADGDAAFAGRIDALVRFHVDPLRESRWAPYAAGGIGAIYQQPDRWRGVLIGALGIEGPPGGGVVPAIEIGFGGGARVGVVLRRAMAGRR